MVSAAILEEVPDPDDDPKLEETEELFASAAASRAEPMAPELAFPLLDPLAPDPLPPPSALPSKVGVVAP
jgi:hypothetical protein